MTGMGSRYRSRKGPETSASKTQQDRYPISYPFDRLSNTLQLQLFSWLADDSGLRPESCARGIVTFRTMRSERNVTLRDLLHRASSRTGPRSQRNCSRYIAHILPCLPLNAVWQVLCSFTAHRTILRGRDYLEVTRAATTHMLRHSEPGFRCQDGWRAGIGQGADRIPKFPILAEGHRWSA